jgi:hypothetical protein
MLAYRLAGMTWIDALIHAFTTMGLGGFSSHDASFGYFDSVAIELVAIVFMTLAGINFATHFVAWHSKSLLAFRRDPEVMTFVFILVTSVVVVGLYLWFNETYPDLSTSMRHAAFNTVSVATTTGYATEDYAKWPFFAPLWLMFLASFVTCSGSAGGGIKMIRPGQDRGPGRTRPRHRRRARVLLCLDCNAGRRNSAVRGHRARHPDRVLRRRRLAGESGTGIARGRPGLELRIAHRRSDVALRRADAARAAGTVHHPRVLHARVLAQVGFYAFFILP